MLKGNLLLVDDEPSIVEILKFRLTDLAENVFTAPDGKEALSVISQNDVHCVVCDINMPVMNGAELIKKLREMKNDVPFIFYTGYGNSALMLEAVKYGAFDFLNKPMLEGIEEVVANGLSVGLNPSAGSADISSDFESEYKKLLKQLKEK